MKTSMAIDKIKLTKEWIDYLKGGRIAFSSNTEPGKLDYRKKVTTDDLSHFLEAKTDFTEEQISDAIRVVLAKKAHSRQPKLQNNSTSDTSVVPRHVAPSQQPPKQIGSNQSKTPPATPKKGYNKDNATDIEYRDINEEMRDDTAYTLDEKDVENIFSILTSAVPVADPKGTNRSGGKSSTTRPESTSNPEELQAKKESEIRKLKRVIREKMSPSQRKTLWRILTDA